GPLPRAWSGWDIWRATTIARPTPRAATAWLWSAQATEATYLRDRLSAGQPARGSWAWATCPVTRIALPLQGVGTGQSSSALAAGNPGPAIPTLSARPAATRPFAGRPAPAWSGWATFRAARTASPPASAPTVRSSSAHAAPPLATNPSAGQPAPAWSD